MERTAAEHRDAVARATDERQYTVHDVTASARERSSPGVAGAPVEPASIETSDGQISGGSYLVPANLDVRPRIDPVPQDGPEDEPRTSWLR